MAPIPNTFRRDRCIAYMGRFPCSPSRAQCWHLLTLTTAKKCQKILRRCRSLLRNDDICPETLRFVEIQENLRCFNFETSQHMPTQLAADNCRKALGDVEILLKNVEMHREMLIFVKCWHDVWGASIMNFNILNRIEWEREWYLFCKVW